MTGHSLSFLDVSVASVATILVDGLDRDRVVDRCERSGLEYEEEGDLVLTTLVRETDDEVVHLLVDFDTADGLVHVHSRDYLDAYGLAPVASELLDAVGGAESQSLFTYSIDFAHPLVDFTTLVEHLEGDGIEFVDPTEKLDGADATDEAASGDAERSAPATDPDAVEGDDRPTPPAGAEPTGPSRPHLSITLDGDLFELYEDGYLLPVDDASASGAAGLVAELNRRLIAALPDPPATVDAAELPEGWAGPLVDRHPNLAGVVDNWATLGEGLTAADLDAIPFDAERDLAEVAETILDLALSLVFAVDHCSPMLREQYYDRYADDPDSPLSLPLLEDGEPRDREGFVQGPLWVPEIERTTAATRREIRDLDTVVASYDGVDLRPGQVWRHHAATRHAVQEVAVIGRQFIGGEFVSLPVWAGEVQSVGPCEHDDGEDYDGLGEVASPESADSTTGDEDAPDDEIGQQVVIHGENLLDLVEDADGL